MRLSNDQQMQIEKEIEAHEHLRKQIVQEFLQIPYRRDKENFRGIEFNKLGFAQKLNFNKTDTNINDLSRDPRQTSDSNRTTNYIHVGNPNKAVLIENNP